MYSGRGLACFTPYHQLVHLMAELFSLAAAVFCRGLRQNDTKFIPAEPPDNVCLSRQAQQYF